MKLYFLKQKSLDMLEQTIPDNLNKYQDAETWVDQYFIDNDKPNYFFDTGIEVDDYQLISGGPETDFSNAKILWTVIRFWGNDIKKNTDECIRVIEETIFEIKTMDDYTEE